MAKRGTAPLSETITIRNSSPDIQISPILLSKRFGADRDGSALLRHLRVRGEHMSTSGNKAYVDLAGKPVGVRREIVLDKPFDHRRGQVAGVANLDMRDRFVAAPEGVDSSGPDIHISALENSGIFALPKSENDQCTRKNGDDESKKDGNFVMIWFDGGSDKPIPVSR